MITHSVSRFLLLLTTAASLGLAHADNLTLVKNGEPNATIVVQADAPAPLRQAADDLQHYIEKISGVRLPLSLDGQDVAGVTLNIGKTATSLPGDLPDATLNPETYAIRQRAGNLYFAGNHPTPTAFAVYSFLQDQLGVRWFAPGDEWEYVPRARDAANFVVNGKDVVSVPGTSPRIWRGHDWNDNWKAWNRRNKMVLSEKVPRHTQSFSMMQHAFPQSKYGASNPEYYPLINGERWIPKQDSYRSWWPCIGNKDVQRLTAAYIHQWFKDNPEADSFSLGIDDVAYTCTCPLCRAMDTHPDDHQKRQLSGRYYKFVNIVAKEVKATDPDKFIAVLIYDIVVKPPVDVAKMEDNVYGYIANGSVAQWYQTGKKQEWYDNTLEWKKRVKYLSRYDYYGLGTFVPRVFPRAMAESIRFDKSLGFEGMNLEVYTFLPQTAPMTWALVQLQWNPELSIEALLDEFYEKMYEGAAPTMRQYFDLMEQSWNTQRTGHVNWVHRSIVRQSVSISPEALHEGLALLDKAKSQTDNPTVIRRIDVTRDGLRYAGYAIDGYALARELNALNVQNSDEARKGVAKAELLAKLIHERDAFWPQARAQQNLLGENLRGLAGLKLGSGESYLQTNTNTIDNPALPGLLNLLDWYEKNDPAQKAMLSQQLLQAFPEGNIRNSLMAWSWVQQNRPANLLKNADFEDTSKNTSPRNTAGVNSDWSAKYAPTGWWTWSRDHRARFGNLQNAGRSSNAVRVIGNSDMGTDNGLVIQSVSVKPDGKYLGMVWVKSPDAEKATEASLTLHFRTDKGFYRGTNAITRMNASSTSDWQLLLIAATVPDGATGVSFMLAADGVEAIYDDAALYEVQF